MLIIRPTLSLSKRMKIKLPAVSDTKSTTKLGDWFAVDIVLDRKQFILAVCEKTRLMALLHAAPYASFPQRLPEAVLELLLAIGISKAAANKEVREMQEVSLAKTNNPSILGTINDYRIQLETQVRLARVNFERLLDLSLHVNETPSLVMEARFPKEATRAVLGS